MKRLARLALSALLAAALPAAAQADFPTKPIRFIVPAAAGGPTDLTARLIAQEMQKTLGQPVVIEPKPGAGGNVGADHVAKSAPDGYTILMATIGTHAINQTLYKSLPFDPIKDFAPVSQVVQYPLIFVVHPSIPAKNVREFIDYAKANPGKLNRASGGSGTSMHLSGELFRSFTGLDLPHIPYKGSAPALNDLVGGQVHLMFDSMMTALPLVKAGKLKPLAIVASKRSTHMPDVPTLDELGYPFVVRAWLGVFAQKAVPDDVARRLNAEIGKILGDPAFREKWLAVQAIDAAPNSLEQFAAFIREDQKVALTNLRAAGIHLD